MTDRTADDGPFECHRRSCTETAAFWAYERYPEENELGAVEAEVPLCSSHAAEERPSNLDADFDDYRFEIRPIGAE